MTVFLGLLPWVMFWMVLGDTSLWLACALATVLAIVLLLLNLAARQRPNILDVGTVCFFAGATIAVIAAPANDLEPWMNAASSWALAIISGISIAIGHPFVRSYARSGVTAEVASSYRFKKVTLRLTVVWSMAFVVAAIAASIPPMMQPGVSLRDSNAGLINVFYWAIPITAFATAAILTVRARRQEPNRNPSL